MSLRIFVAILCICTGLGAAELHSELHTLTVAECETQQRMLVWDTTYPLLLRVDGWGTQELNDKLYTCRSFSDLLSLVELTAKWSSYAFSDVILSLQNDTTGTAADISNLSAYVASTAQELQKLVGANSTTWTEMLKSAAWFAVDPAGIMSAAANTAGDVAREGLAQLLETSGFSSAANLLKTTNATDDQVRNTIAAVAAGVAKALKKPEGALAVTPYGSQFVALMWDAGKQQQQQRLLLSCRLNPIAIRFPLRLALGLLVFRAAPSFAESATLYYGSGAMIGGFLALALLAVFLFRNRNNKIVVGSGVAAFLYGFFQSHVGHAGSTAPLSTVRWVEEMFGLPQGSVPLALVAYVVAAAIGVGLWLYIAGPIQNPRLLNVITVGWRMAGAALIYLGTQSSELSGTLVAITIVGSIAGSAVADALFFMVRPFAALAWVFRITALLLRILSCNVCCRRHGRLSSTTQAAELATARERIASARGSGQEDFAYQTEPRLMHKTNPPAHGRTPHTPRRNAYAYDAQQRSSAAKYNDAQGRTGSAVRNVYQTPLYNDASASGRGHFDARASVQKPHAAHSTPKYDSYNHDDPQSWAGPTPQRQPWPIAQRQQWEDTVPRFPTRTAVPVPLRHVEEMSHGEDEQQSFHDSESHDEAQYEEFAHGEGYISGNDRDDDEGARDDTLAPVNGVYPGDEHVYSGHKRGRNVPHREDSESRDAGEEHVYSGHKRGRDVPHREDIESRDETADEGGADADSEEDIDTNRPPVRRRRRLQH